MKIKYLIWFFLLFLIHSNLYAQEIAKLESSQGIVEAKLFPQTDWAKTQISSSFKFQDAVRTGINSRAAVLFIDGILVRLNEATLLEFKADSSIEMGSGTAYFFSRQPRQFPVIKTPIVSAAIRGTEVVVESDESKAVISVLDGTVECSNEQGSVTVSAGEQATTIRGRAPVKSILLRPLDAVQWALYYPAILDPADYADTDKNSKESIEQSALYLQAGQVKKAEAVLEQVKSTLSTAYLSQKSIIALVNNRKEEAFDFAQKAVESNPNSSSAALAMSYVQQSLFRLEDALHWANEAKRIKPNNAFILTRIAELELGFGHIKKALNTINEAIKIAPEDPRALTVLGYTYLVQYMTKEAVNAFEKAIALDSTNALPRIGKGLGMIRENKLREGRREIELGAFLEPNISLYRSYLGKAYYEEKRDSTAAHEYDIAKKLDPMDPTPYLYDAFNKMANTRPIEALWDIEDSIKLNENRAIYRSRLLLDQDQAVRSSGLSQVFTSIGFSEAGRIEAIKSINRDYSNFSAHLLLAGIYFEFNNLAQATISEQLITRLLVPHNFNPVDPSTRGDASFNEYTSLFDRNRMRVFLDGAGRSADDFIKGRILHSGAFEKLFYILSYFPDYMNGYRENDWSRFNAGSLFIQYQLNYNDTINIETLLGEQEEGDPVIGFDPQTDNPVRNLDQDLRIHRVGYHHKFGPEAHLISQVMYFNQRTILEDRLSRLFTIDSILPDSILSDYIQDEKFEGVRGDVQYIRDSSIVSLLVGCGLLSSETNNEETSAASTDSLNLLSNITLSSTGEHPEESIRLYTYSTWHLAEWLDVTLGGNYTQLELADISIPPPFSSNTRTIDKFNPKAGLTFYITPSTIFRTAYFETMGPAGIFDLENIEPTLVAGFNQLIDEIPGTDSKTIGIGIDQKISKWTYLGIEARHKESTVDLGIADSILNLDGSTSNISPTTITEQETKLDQLTGYFYKVLHKTLTGTLDYTVSQPEDELFSNENTTHRIKIGFNYFHPKGWFAKTSGTWRTQDIIGFGIPKDGERDFWLVDASIGYQLPKRYGVVALTVTNIFDQDFLYEPIGIDALFLPRRSVNFKFTLNF